MVQFSVASGNGVVSSPRSFVFYALGEYGGICHSSLPRCVSFSCSLSDSRIRCNSQNGLISSTRIKSVPGGKWSNAHLRTLEDVDIRRKPSPRLWSNAKFFSKRLRKFSVQSAINDFGAFMKKNIKTVVLTTTMSVALGSCYLVFRLMAIPSPKLVPYSDLVTNLQNGSVTNVLFEEGSRRIYFNTECKTDETPMTDDKKVSPEEVQSESMAGEVARKGFKLKFQIKGLNLFKRSVPRSTASPVWKFSTRKIDHDERFLLTLMREKGTSYSSAPQSPLMSIRGIMITVLTLWIPLTPLMWLLYRQLNSANNPARKRHPDLQVVNFNDVEGVDSAKTELLEIVMCLRGSIDYDKLGAKLPRGVLLIGPPGTGKTLLARAVAGEAGVPFFSVSASEFVELFVGRGAARIRDLFRVARKCSPSIVFIDELDAVGGKRGRSFNDERDQTLNQLLTEMDGFETDSKVVVIAATNRPEALDSALCRPGRFSRKVLVGEPDEEGRRKILSVHLKEVPLEEDKQLMCSLVASLTQGLVGADLANIVNEAALLAARRGGQVVSREDIMEAIERAKFGIVNNKSQGSSFLAKELGKLFPWMPALTGRNIASSDEMEGPTGYQTLS